MILCPLSPQILVKGRAVGNDSHSRNDSAEAPTVLFEITILRVLVGYKIFCEEGFEEISDWFETLAKAE